MKQVRCIIYSILFFSITVISGSTDPLQDKQAGYIIEHETEMGVQQPGPHNGGGLTTGYGFFAKADNLNMIFRKRILHPGSSIGYHLQNEDEIYYIAKGIGEMKINGKTFPVKEGDAILTRPGSSHGLAPAGNEDLVVFIVYEQ
jgi:mannose-6-phosphate isomerase-like protein (cupin superfamily)